MDRIVYEIITGRRRRRWKKGARISWLKGFHVFACPKRHSIAHYVQLGPAYYHFHRNQRYDTHKAYRLIDNSPSVITKIPEKERGRKRERGLFWSLRFFFLFYVRGTRVSIFFLTSLFDWGFLKGFFLFDGSWASKKVSALFFCILFVEFFVARSRFLRW